VTAKCACFRGVAIVNADAATVDRLLPDDYTATNKKGLTRTRAQLVADLEAGAVKREGRRQPVAHMVTAIK
jgi:hypothetical protein